MEYYLAVVLNAARSAQFYSTLTDLIGITISLVISIFALIVAQKFYKKHRSDFPANPSDMKGDDIFLIVLFWIVVIIMIILGFISFIRLISPSNWIGLFNPDAALAIKFLGL